MTFKPLAPAFTRAAPMSSSVYLRSSLDEHMSCLYPNNWQPTPQEQIRAGLYARGTTDAMLLLHLEKFNQRWDAIFGQYPDGKLPTLGVCTA